MAVLDGPRPTDFISVAEDIEYLAREWASNVSGDVLRRGSVTLRLLVVDGLLGRAWRACDAPTKQPTVPAVDLSQFIAEERAHGAVVEWAVAGGTHGLTTLVMSTRVDGREVPNPPMSSLRAFSLHDFAEAPGAYDGTRPIARREIIKYFANVKGGAHLHLSSRTRAKEDELVRRFEKIKGRFSVHDRDGLFHALFGIGQAVASAPDVQWLCARIRSSDAG